MSSSSGKVVGILFVSSTAMNVILTLEASLRDSGVYRAEG
jgi:hypothetical protein